MDFQIYIMPLVMGKPIAEIQRMSRGVAEKSLRFEDASNRHIFGTHDKDGVVKVREAVYEVNNHLMDASKEPKDILPRIKRPYKRSV